MTIACVCDSMSTRAKCKELVIDDSSQGSIQCGVDLEGMHSALGLRPQCTRVEATVS